jgi:hypothetical protein
MEWWNDGPPQALKAVNQKPFFQFSFGGSTIFHHSAAQGQGTADFL